MKNIKMTIQTDCTTDQSNNFFCQYRIYYEDTDSGGVVYYANYLKFFERARTEFLRSLNISQQQLKEQENLLFVVKNCQIDYRKSAKLDDLINVSVKIAELRPASILFFQQITLDQQILVDLQTEIVAVDLQNFRPKKIPQPIKNLLYVR